MSMHQLQPYTNMFNCNKQLQRTCLLISRSCFRSNRFYRPVLQDKCEDIPVTQDVDTEVKVSNYLVVLASFIYLSITLGSIKKATLSSRNLRNGWFLKRFVWYFKNHLGFPRKLNLTGSFDGIELFETYTAARYLILQTAGFFFLFCSEYAVLFLYKTANCIIDPIHSKVGGHFSHQSNNLRLL